MAGHWEYYTVWDWRREENVQRKRWVVDPAPIVHAAPHKANKKQIYKPVVTPAIKAHAAQIAQQAHAKVDAAAARSAMWDSLHHRAAAIRSSIGSPSPLAPTSGALAARAAAEYARSERARRLAAVKAAIGTSGAKYLENLTKTLAASQVADPTNVDTELLTAIQRRYQNYVTSLSATYAKWTHDINSYFTIDKKGAYHAKTVTSYAEAMKKFNDPRFKAMQAELARLQGTAQKPGALSIWATTSESIAEAQRKYLYDTAKAAIFSKLSGLDANAKRAMLPGLTKQWENEKYFYDYARQMINPDQTSTKWAIDPQGRTILVHRTVDEELAYRREQYVAEMKRQYDAYAARQQGEIAKNRSLSAEIGGIDNVRDQQNQKRLVGALSAAGFTGDKMPTTYDDIQRVVTEGLNKWITDHRDLMLPPRIRAQIDAGGRAREYAMNSKEYQSYQIALKAAEKTFYDMLHTGQPGFLDTIVHFGPVTGLMNATSALLGGIGGAAKVTASVVAGKPVEFVLAGRNYSVSDLPNDIAQQVTAAAERYAAAMPTTGYASRFSNQSRLEQGYARALEEIAKPWLSSDPAGQRWAADNGLFEGAAGLTSGRSPADTARIQQSMKDFYDQFYVNGVYKGVAGLGGVAKGLGEYGASPFTPDSAVANLAFGALDPLNAVPLKFTTWVDRLHEAVRVGEGATFFKKVAMQTHRWLTVTEPELKLTKELQKLKWVKSAEEADIAASNILKNLLGINSKAAEKTAVDRVVEAMGLVRQTPDGRAMATAVEEALAHRAHAAGVNFETLTQHLKNEEAKQAAADLAAKQLRRETLNAAEAKAVAREQALANVMLAERNAATAAHQAELAKATLALADAKGYKGLSIVRTEGMTGRSGRTVAARYSPAKPGVPAHIQLDEATLRLKYEAKAWTTPAQLHGGGRVAALPENQFRSYESFRKFALEHEYQHHMNPRLPHETLGVYEQRINELALTGRRIPPRPTAVRAAAAQGSVADARALAAEAIQTADLRPTRLAQAQARLDAALYSPNAVGAADHIAMLKREVAALTNDLHIRPPAPTLGIPVGPAPSPRFVPLPSVSASQRPMDELLTGLTHARAMLVDERGVFRPILDVTQHTPTSRAAEANFLEALSQSVEMLKTVEFSPTAIAELRKSVPIARQLPGGAEIVADAVASINAHLGAMRLEDKLSHGFVDNQVRNARIAMAQQTLQELSGLDEAGWLARDLQAARSARATATGANRAALFSRIRRLERVSEMVAIEKSGGHYASYAARDRFLNRTNSLIGDDVTEVFHARLISPFVTGAAGAEIEQGRSYYRRFVDALVEPGAGPVRAKTASATYATHGAAIEKALDSVSLAPRLEALGVRSDLARSLTVLDILASPDELANSLKHTEFTKVFDTLVTALNKDLRRVTGDAAYSVDHFLSDRLLHGGDHYPVRVFEKHDQIFAKEIAQFRKRYATTYTRLRRRPGGTAFADPVIEVMDRELAVIAAKARVAKREGIDLHRYNQARLVLGRAMVAKRVGTRMANDASKLAGDYTDNFLKIREVARKEEARKLLEGLAGGEMYGRSAADIADEFRARYQLDNEIKPIKQDLISDFQYNTLGEASSTMLGVSDLGDQNALRKALNSHGQAPPFGDRSAMREWLVKRGVWTPRTAQAIESGRLSWSIHDEYEYYWKNYGFAPDWANPHLLAPGEKWGTAIYDRNAYSQMLKDQGLFSDNMEARFLTGKLSLTERLKLRVTGDEAKGLKPERDLPLMRRYVIERYGSLAADAQGNLIAFPWLMHADEYKKFLGTKMAESLPDGFVKTAVEHDAVLAIVNRHVGAMFDTASLRGRTISHEEFFNLSGRITAEVLADPALLRRGVDRVGEILKLQHDIRAGLIFSQIGFASTNVVDSYLKETMIRIKDRALLTAAGDISPDARALSVIDLGFDKSTQLLMEDKPHGLARVRAAELAKHPTLERLIGVSEIPAAVAGHFEQAAKLRLGQQMYDVVYARALAEKGNARLARAFTLDFVSKEVQHFWPHVGNGTIERLFNRISPFASYQLKNRVMFVREGLAHPVIFNYLQRIGDFIEQQNRANWAQDNPGVPFDDKTARLIQLPWTHGSDAVFIDLGVFTDAQRGLQPIFDIRSGQKAVGKLLGEFVRLAGANDINFVGGILNGLDIPMRQEWRLVYDAKGFSTGNYELVDVPWAAPWGVTANSVNSFWPLEILGDLSKFHADGVLTAGEITQLVSHTLFFGGLRPYDRMGGINDMYFALVNSGDKAAARAFLQTDAGLELMAHWRDRTYGFYIDPSIKNDLAGKTPEAIKAHYVQSPEWIASVKDARAGLKILTARWDQKIGSLTPGTVAYSDAKKEARTAYYAWYATHPQLYEADAWFKTPADWAKMQESWKTDSEIQSFYNIYGQAPQRSDYKSIAAWTAANVAYRKSRDVYLAAHPNAAAALGSARNSLELMQRNIEETWFQTLDRIGTRQIAIEAAKQAKNYSLVDQLYLANNLDYSTLQIEHVASYFDPQTDYKPLSAFAKERGLDPSLISPNLLPHVKLLTGFDKWRFSRLDPAGKAKFEADKKYADGMAGVIAKAKASKNFGATFVAELRKNPALMNAYFARNPGKREKWAATDQYISLISHYGILAKSGKFAEAGKYFDSLPAWAKDRYFQKHPDRRAKAQQNLLYLSFMKRWVSHYQRRDYKGGADFFKKMPQWVQDRYLAKHPKGSQGGGSPYAAAMGKWVALLQAGKKDQAKAYFASLPKAYKDRYYNRHPDARLRNDIKRTGQLGEYFSADDANRIVYLKNNPEFAKWLHANNKSTSDRFRLITAAYRALPKDDAWLRRVFREKYPEVFSQQAKGEAGLKKVYAFLSQHPNFLPSWQKWVDAVWASYAQEQKHTLKPPRPIVWDHTRQRQHGLTHGVLPHHGMSAAWVRLHSVA